MSASSPESWPLLDHDLLRTFVAISDTGSFTRAARRIHRTTSAVSMQVKRLEQLLGRTLLHRQGRRVSLTTDGEALLFYARRMLELNEEAVARFFAPEIEGHVRFGAPDDFGTRFLPDILRRFASSHPMVEVDVVLDTSTRLMAQLETGNLDLTLFTAGSADQGWEPGSVVHAGPLAWVALEGGRAPYGDPLRLALSSRSCPWRGTALAALDAAGRPYRVAYNSEHTQGQLAAVLADLAIAPLPVSLITAPYALVDPCHELPDLGEYYVLLFEGPESTPAAAALADQIRSGLAASRERCYS
jgi:DNA-binding transcriptional LysR family regulator